MATASSDFNLQKINTKEYSEHLRATIEFGGNLIAIARRGTGKTLIAKEVIEQAGCRELYYNLSMADRVDLAGYPRLFHTDPKYKYVEYLLPQNLAPLLDGDKPVVVVLDEVDKCDSSLWGPMLELTQFHTANARELRNLKAIIMTGNLQSEGGQRPIPALTDRGEKYLVEASVQHWLDWASATRSIHPSITAFISDNGEELFGDVDPGELYADPSPRGWHNASKILSFGEEHRWSPRLLTTKVSGCVGKKTGLKYSSYFEHYVVLLPYVERIMKGEDMKDFSKLEPSKQCVCSMIVCARLAKLIDEMKPAKNGKQVFPKECDAVGKFLQSIDPEMALIAFRGQVGLKRAISSGLDEAPLYDALLRQIVKRIGH
jgi:hypothetical protein